MEIEFALLPQDRRSADIIRHLLKAVLLKAERILNPGRAAGDLEASGPFHSFRKLLEREFMNHRAVEYYCFSLGINAKGLNQVTRAVAQKTVKEMIDQRVLLEAMRLLAHTELSVMQLAHRLKFDEPTNFVKFFRRLSGKSPTDFRVESRKSV